MRSVIFFALCAILFVSCRRNVIKDMQALNLKNQLIGVENALNARQLGGYSIGSKVIKENLLLRCGKLSQLSGTDSALLTDKYKVQCIYDLRGEEEIVSERDVVPSGARYFPLPISFSGSERRESIKFDSQDAVIGMLLENAEHPAVQNMCANLYEIIFFEESFQEIYRKFFADLVSLNPDNGAVLWHCTQGKDRAGCASAMLLAALGADRNHAPIVSQIPVKTEAQSSVINTLIGANPVIFEAALDKIDDRYGSFGNYLKECIGVTEPMMQALRERYLK